MALPEDTRADTTSSPATSMPSTPIGRELIPYSARLAPLLWRKTPALVAAKALLETYQQEGLPAKEIYEKVISGVRGAALPSFETLMQQADAPETSPTASTPT